MNTVVWRGVAVGTVAVYLLLLAAGWIANVSAGFDGILRPQPHELASGRPFTVLEVEPGSPADLAQIHAGDQIVAVDGNPFVYDIHQTYHNRSAGTAGSLRVVSPDESTRLVPLTLESRLGSPRTVVNLALASLLGIAIMAVGACVLFVRPDSLPARLLLAFAGALAVSTPSDLWHWTQRTASSATLLDQVSGLVALIGAVALLHFFLVFPAPGALFARFGALIRPLYVAALLVIPLGTVLGGAGVSSIASGLLLAVLLIGTLVALELSYRNPVTPLARAQLEWVRLGLAAGVVMTLAERLARALAPESVPAVVSAAVSLAWLVFPVSVALAVLRYRLFEVDRVVRASITWGLLAAILLGSYLALVLLLGRLTASAVGGASDPTVAVVGVLLIAVLVHPLRARLQSALDQFIYRQRFARARLLDQATELLSQPQPVDAIARFLCRQVPLALGLSGGWLAVPAEKSTAFEGDGGVLLPNVSLASPALLDLARGADGPRLLAPLEDRPAYEGMPTVTLSTETVGAQQWYLAGARVVVPLRTGAGDVLGLWLLGAPSSGDLLDRADLVAFARLAMLAEMQLERRRASVPGASMASATALKALTALTAREQEVFVLLGRGCSNREIADELVISVRTAETHVERVLQKLGLDNRSQAMLLARDMVAEHVP